MKEQNVNPQRKVKGGVRGARTKGQAHTDALFGPPVMQPRQGLRVGGWEKAGSDHKRGHQGILGRKFSILTVMVT